MDIIELNRYNALIMKIKSAVEMQNCTRIFNEDPEQIISRFHINTLYEEFRLHDFYLLPTFNNDEMYFGTLAVVYSIQKGKTEEKTTEIQSFVLKKLERNYETMLIKPESLQDKIMDIFIKDDIDFSDYPDFSKKYYFIAKNKDLALKFATAKRIDLITEQDKIIVEISGDFLFAKYARKITEKDCKLLIRFINLI